MKYLEEKYYTNLYKKERNFGKLVLMLSLVVKIKEIDAIAQHDYMDGIVHEMDPLLVALGVDQHHKTNEPQDPIYQMNYLQVLLEIVFKDLRQLRRLEKEIANTNVETVLSG